MLSLDHCLQAAAAAAAEAAARRGAEAAARQAHRLEVRQREEAQALANLRAFKDSIKAAVSRVQHQQLQPGLLLLPSAALPMTASLLLLLVTAASCCHLAWQKSDCLMHTPWALTHLCATRAAR